MKWKLILSLSLVSLLPLLSCGGEGSEESEPAEEVAPPAPAESPLQAQTLYCSAAINSEIGGYVTNAQSGAGVSGVSVEFGNSCPYGAITTTNASGNWFLTLPADYTYPVTVRATGYVTLNTSRLVGRGSFSQNYSLTPNLTRARLGGQTHPDHTVFATNTSFLKEWTVYNNGTTVWPIGTYLRYVSGPMSTDRRNLTFGSSVAPGAGIIFRASMRTPATSGSYRDDWDLRTASGTLIPVDGSSTVWALIDVVVPPDAYEPDNDSSRANALGINSTSPAHSIVPASDVDWYRFTLDRAMDIRLQTDGASGDSRMWLYNSSLSELAFDDDSNGLFSRITRAGLSAGTYYVKVDSYRNLAEIPSYTLSLTATPSNTPPSVAFYSPADESTISSSPVTVDVACVDTDSNLSSASVENQANGWSRSYSLSGSFQRLQPANIDLSSGLNRIAVTCRDSASGTTQGLLGLNYNGCPDGTPRDAVGLPCNHNDCADGTARDNYNDACSHDEDGDTIHDDSDACPDQENDTTNNPCNPNDNADLDLTGGDPIGITLFPGTNNQTRTFAVTNRGSGGMTYRFSLASPAPWLHLVKNGGTTNALTETHELASGRQDLFVASLNAIGLAPGTTVSTTLNLSADNDSSEGSRSIPIDLTVAQPPYCTGACQTPASQTLGGDFSTVATVGDPVNTATGNYSYRHTDLALKGRGLSLLFARTYNSQDKYLGPLGFGWTHSYNIVAAELTDGKVAIRWGDGRTEVYSPNGDGSYSPPDGVFMELTGTAGGGWSLVAKDQTTFLFTEEGQISRMIDRNGNEIRATYDDQRRLVTVADLTGKSLSFSYVPGDPFKIESVTDSTGRSIRFAYEADDLVRFTDRSESTSQYRYNGEHELTEIIDSRGNPLVRNDYDEESRVTGQRDARGSATQIRYETPEVGSVTIDDPRSQSFQQVYGDALKVLESQDPFGRGIFYEYNARGLRTASIDRRGNRMTAAYDDRGNVISLTDPLQAVTQFEYDPATDDLIKVTEPTGHERNFEYDAEGNLTRVWETLDGGLIEQRFLYNEWGQMTGSTDAEGNPTFYEYDAAGNLVLVRDPAGGETRYEYDAAGRVISVTDPLGRETETRYDPNDRVIEIIDANDENLLYVYDANGNPIRVTDRLDQVTEFEWDANDFLTLVRDPARGETRFSRDAMNRPTDRTDPEGRITGFTYDAGGNLETVTAPLSRLIRYEYDSEGNLTVRIDPDGGRWTYTYDALNRVTEAADPLGNRTGYLYDPESGLLTEVIDPEEGRTQFRYDELGRLVSATDPSGGVTTYEYNRVGQLVRLTNPGRNPITFEYDAAGRLVSETDPLGAREQFFYDLAGQLDRSVDRRGQTTRYRYDPLGRTTAVTYEDGSEVRWTYDSEGRRTGRTDSSGTSAYQYDSLGRLTSFSDPRGFAIGYRYDRTGLQTDLTYPGQRTVLYRYNGAGQMREMEDWLRNITGYSYDDGGRLSRIDYPNRLAATFGYDDASRLTEVANLMPDASLLSRYRFTLDGRGNRISVEKEEPLKAWISPEETDARYNGGDELLAIGTFSNEYDANGNLVQESSINTSLDLTFGVRDELTELDRDGAVIGFLYDGDGNRIGLRRDGVTQQFVVDPNRALPDLIAEADGDGNIGSYYLYGIGLAAQVSADGSRIRYYHFDPIGSTIALSDPAGQVTDSYSYDEFGRLNRRTGTTENRFRFVGRLGVQDDETGLFHMRARYYDPVAGRFVSRDTIGLAGGMNRYLYAGNDPVSEVDPSGLIASNYSQTNSSIWGSMNGVTGSAGYIMTGGQVGLGRLAYYRPVGLAFDPVGVDLNVIPPRNSVGNFRGMVRPGGGTAAGTMGTLGRISTALLWVSAGLTVLEDRSIDKIAASTDQHGAAGFGVETLLSVGRVGAKMIFGSFETLSGGAAWIGENVPYYSNGQPNTFFRSIETSARRAGQDFDQYSWADMDQWDAQNRRRGEEAFEAYWGTDPCRRYSVSCSLAPTANLFSTLNLSGGLSTGNK